MAWLGTYKYRYKMLIPAGTAIYNTLIDFPVTVHFGIKSGINQKDTTFIFEVLQDKIYKYAVTGHDGITRLHSCIEKWDYTNGDGVIHLKMPEITVDNTYFYIYFDDNTPDDTEYTDTNANSPIVFTAYATVLNFKDENSEGLIGYAKEFVKPDEHLDLTANSKGTIEVLMNISPDSGEGLVFGSGAFVTPDQYICGLLFKDNNFYLVNMHKDLTYEPAPGQDPQQCMLVSDTGFEQLNGVWIYAAFVTSGEVPPLIFINDDYVRTGYEKSEFFSAVAIPSGMDIFTNCAGLAGFGPFERPTITYQTIRNSTGEKPVDFILASRLGMIDRLVSVDVVEFYENTVNGIPFDLIGGTTAATYFKLLITHDSYVDLFVPIESFQFRHTSGAEAYLSVIIPDFSYYDSIVLRDGGKLRLHMLTGSMTEADIDRDNLIVQVDLDIANLRYDVGGNSKSITLDGYGIYGSRYLTLDLPNNSYKTYENENGTQRFRFPGPFYFLRTNDTVTIDGVEIDVLDISANRTGNGGQMEVSDG